MDGGWRKGKSQWRKNEMPVVSINHFTILTQNLDGTIKFYNKLGLIEGPRPPLQVPGAWLYIGKKALLHIIEDKISNKKSDGLIDHLAFSAKNLNNTIKILEKERVEYSIKRQAKTNVWQIFFYDPNKIKVELDFDKNENGL